MKRIGLLSDTHGYLIPQLFRFFEGVDEIWHAGDIGNINVALELENFRPMRAVYGNVDTIEIRTRYKETDVFTCGEMKIFMTHIGGYPGRYARGIKSALRTEKPDIFISGHSHILKIMPDPELDLLHINPGSAGKSGLHKKITMIRFLAEKDKIRELEVFDMKRY